MKTIILYYSLLGSTRTLAMKKAEEYGADIEEIIQTKKYNLFTSYVVGAFKSMRRKPVPIHPLQADLEGYERIVIMSPVWAACPAPAINSVFQLLPAGKKVELIMLSEGSGSAKTAKQTMEIVTASGCEVIGYIDVIKKKKQEIKIS